MAVSDVGTCRSAGAWEPAGELGMKGTMPRGKSVKQESEPLCLRVKYLNSSCTCSGHASSGQRSVARYDWQTSTFPVSPRFNPVGIQTGASWQSQTLYSKTHDYNIWPSLCSFPVINNSGYITVVSLPAWFIAHQEWILAHLNHPTCIIYLRVQSWCHSMGLTNV